MPVYIPYADTGYFSPIVLDYLAQADYLKPFYGLPPIPGSFEEQIKQKSASFSRQAREALHQEVVKQHGRLGNLNPEVQKNIGLLGQPDTFTVTTGHQLCLFTGPLYFVYKIITVIRACQELKAIYPAYNFVPLFWMATEDHDFEEVNHFRFQDRTYAWHTSQQGAVGRFSTDGLEEVFARLPGQMPLFEEPYLQHANLADATRELVHRLFGQYGVVSLDADVPGLKKAFAEVARQDLLDGTSQRKVHEVTVQLAAYHKMQVTSRPINLFYLADGLRERIERDGEKWKVLNTDLTFTREEILQELEQHPGRFSPNVLLRPLYQELILPNLAYVGGGAEVAYWLELKKVFEHFGTPFPILMLRNSALYVPASLNMRLHKLQLALTDLFKGPDELKKQVLGMQQGFEPVSVQALQHELGAIYAQAERLAQQTDPTLIKAVAAAHHRAAKGLDVLEKKLNRAAEKRFSTVTGQLSDLLERLFPGGGLQERQENVATFMAGNAHFIKQMTEAFDPFGHNFTIVQEQPDAN